MTYDNLSPKQWLVQYSCHCTAFTMGARTNMGK